MLVPSREEFWNRARPGSIVPVYREVLADRLTPVSAFEAINGGPGSFLLESVEGGENVARFSFLGTGAKRVYRAARGEATWYDEAGETTEAIAEGEDVLHPLERILARYRFVDSPDLPKFCGGAVGFLSYDAVRGFERLPSSAHDDLGVDDACFIFTDLIIIFDHVRHRLKVLCNARVDEDAGAAYDDAARRIDDVVERLRHYSPAAPRNASHSMPAIRANMHQADYEKAVARAKEYIAAGDAFQVVPSVRLTAEVSVPPFELYRALRSINPSPYMYFLDFGDKQIVGSSPEILVTVEGSKVRVRPIAGTRPRGATALEDQRLEDELLADDKECAEHIMLVDLGRNDVGRVAEYGSVSVDELMVVEKYSHVMHIVSNVSGRLRPDRSVFDVVRACFPAGTLTGAPKVRAMEIIEELEPTRRGLYGGAVGYFSFTGDADFAIAIRTMLVEGGRAHIQAGAGVVADSVPANEYRECMNKARALLAAVAAAEAGLD